jgi:hypothetical protein
MQRSDTIGEPWPCFSAMAYARPDGRNVTPTARYLSERKNVLHKKANKHHSYFQSAVPKTITTNVNSWWYLGLEQDGGLAV